MDEGSAGVGVKIISREQVHARSAGCERPRMIFGRRIEYVQITEILTEAAQRIRNLIENLDSGFYRNDMVGA